MMLMTQVGCLTKVFVCYSSLCLLVQKLKQGKMDQIQPGRILSEAFAIGRIHTLPLLGLAIIITLPPEFIIRAIDQDMSFGLQNIISLPFMIIGQLAALTIGLFGANQQLGFFQSLQKNSHRFGSFLGQAWLSGIVSFIGLLLFIVPGIYIAVMLSVSGAIVIAEEKSAGASLERSRELVRNHGWQVFGILVAIILFGILLVAFGYLAITLLQDIILPLIGATTNKPATAPLWLGEITMASMASLGIIFFNVTIGVIYRHLVGNNDSKAIGEIFN
jgi:hypothetical protein